MNREEFIYFSLLYSYLTTIHSLWVTWQSNSLLLRHLLDGIFAWIGYFLHFLIYTVTAGLSKSFSSGQVLYPCDKTALEVRLSGFCLLLLLLRLPPLLLLPFFSSVEFYFCDVNKFFSPFQFLTKVYPEMLWASLLTLYVFLFLTLIFLWP